MRDNLWLDLKLSEIWERHFSDVPRSNEVEIKFGRCARTRLGSIRHHKNCHSEFISESPNNERSRNKFGVTKLINFTPNTLITLTGFFKDERVPQYILNLTIAHELCHYAHGFFSPRPKLSRYPHQGGLVDNELKKRGFGDQLKMQKKWLKEEWPKIIGIKCYRRRRIIRRRRNQPFNPLKFLISN